MAKKQWKVPLNKDGSLLHYASAYFESANVDWVEPFRFEATLQLDRMQTGRSAKYVWWIDTTTGQQYPMFITDLMEVVRSGCLKGGIKQGTWKTVKRGQNFGISPVYDY
jgi:hypothetical protein